MRTSSVSHVRSAVRRFAAACLVAAIVGGCTTKASSSPSPTVDLSLSCATTAAAMVTSADLGSFTQFADGPLASLGLHGVAPHPIDAAFLGGRSRMWLATMALSGRYRADNDAYARSLGYTVGDLPLIPLVGSIVTEHPADPLVVFERILVFSDASWASQWLGMARSTVTMQGTSTANGVPQPSMALASVSLGDQALAVIEPGPAGGAVATTGNIGVEVRVGRTVVDVTVEGGTGLLVGQVQALAQKALSHLETACSGG